MSDTNAATAALNALRALGIEVPDGSSVTMTSGSQSFEFEA